MSAGITITKGQAEMMYVGERPWHGLGTELPKLATAEEAMQAAHLDWTVETRPMYYPTNKPGKDMQQAFGRFAIVRQDTGYMLGHCGDGWSPLQNKTAFQFSDALVEEKAAIYETAGSLGGGKKVFLLARLDGVCQVAGDDVLDRYLLLSNSHEGGHAFQVRLTTVRVVCQNTLSQALAEKGQKYFRIHHHKNIADKVKDAREALGLVNKQFKQLQEKLAKLAATPVRQAQVETFAEALGWQPDATEGRAKTAWEEFQQAFETSPGAKLASANGTAWGLVNAVTYLVDHQDLKATKNHSAEDRQLKALFFGSGSTLKEQALDTALQLAGVK